MGARRTIARRVRAACKASSQTRTAATWPELQKHRALRAMRSRHALRSLMKLSVVQISEASRKHEQFCMCLLCAVMLERMRGDEDGFLL